MLRPTVRTDVQVLPAHHAIPLVSLIGTNLLFNVIANSGFKFSAMSSSWRGFLGWQVVGNLAGLVTVLTLTGLLRFVPLRTAYPVTTGLAVIGVQLAARVLFDEPISSPQWLGTLLVATGITLIGGK